MVEQLTQDVNAQFEAGWWKPMVKDSEGNVYVAFTVAATGLINGLTSHHVKLAKRDTSGNWTYSDPIQSKGVDAKYQDDPGHRQTCLAIDGDGRIHLWASMHNSWWDSEDQPSDNELGYGHYFRSETPGDITSMVDCSTELPNQSGESNNYRYTYPIACTDLDGNVHLLIRRMNASGSAPLIYIRWNNTAETWSAIRIADNTSETVSIYPDDICATGTGSATRVHFTWGWRYGSAGNPRHKPAYMRVNPNNDNFYNAAGSNITSQVPVLHNVTHICYQDLLGNETMSTSNPYPGQVIAKMAIDPDTGNPSIAYRLRKTDSGPFYIRRARWNGSGWTREDVYSPPSGKDTGRAIGITHDGTNVTIHFITNTSMSYLTGTKRYAIASKSGSGSWSVAEYDTNFSDVERLSLDGGYVYLVNPPTGDHWLIT